MNMQVSPNSISETRSIALLDTASAISDAEIIGMASEIVALRNEADQIDEERVYHHDDEYDRLLGEEVTAESFTAASAFSVSSGRDGGITEINRKLGYADRLLQRILSTPAQTQEARQAKLAAVFVHVLCSEDWLKPPSDTDFEIEVVRQLLCELSGVTVHELFQKLRVQRPKMADLMGG